MEEVARSIRVGSTFRDPTRTIRSYFFGGLIAGEGCFGIPPGKPLADGSVTLRFVFSLTMASRDRPLLEELRSLLAFGAVNDAPPARAGWLPTTTLTISSRKAHFASTVPFMDEFLLPPTQKRRQYELWRSALLSYDSLRPRKVGRSTCSKDGCDDAVRGRGLCRRHYYRATGY